MLKIFNDKKFLIILLIINIISGIIALTYYYDQLISTNIFLWIFVADCPIFAFLFSYLLFSKIKNEPNNLLALITISGVLKYSIWTIIVILFTTNVRSFGLILLAHILFLLQIIVFYKDFTFKIKHILFTLIIFLVSDFFDYVLLTHPPINNNFFIEIAILSVFLSFFSVLFIAIFFSKK